MAKENLTEQARNKIQEHLETEIEAKTVTKTVGKLEAEAESMANEELQEHLETETEAKTEAEAEEESRAQEELQEHLETETGTEAEAKTETEAEAETETETEAETEAEAEAETETESEPLNPPQEPHIPKGWFNIVAKSGLCISTRYIMQNLLQEECGDLDVLLWRAEKYKNGYFLINKDKQRGAMTIMQSQGTNVIQSSYSKVDPVTFAIESVGNGNYVHLRDIYRTPKVNCLEDTGFNQKMKPGINLMYKMRVCRNWNPHQWFEFKSPKKSPKLYPNGWFHIVGANGSCMDANRNSPKYNLQKKCTDKKAPLLWKAERTSQGLRIINKNKFELFASQPEVVMNNEREKQSLMNMSELWAVEPANDGYSVQIRHMKINKCLSNDGRVVRKVKAYKNDYYNLDKCDFNNKHRVFKLVDPNAPKLTAPLYKVVEKSSLVAPKKMVAHIPKGWFNIVGKSGLCLSAKFNHNNVLQEKCGDYDMLLWRAVKGKNGYILITKDGNNNRLLHSNLNFIVEEVYSKKDKNPATYAIESVQSGNYVHLRDVLDEPQQGKDRCLEDTGFNQKTPAGINLEYRMRICRDYNPHQWFLLKSPPKKTPKLYPDGWFHIVGSNGKCMMGLTRKTTLRLKFQANIQVDCKDKNKDIWWKVERTQKGLTIVNKNKWVIDGTHMVMSEYRRKQTVGVQAQLWDIEFAHDGHIQIRNFWQNKCITELPNGFKKKICSRLEC
jgi:hypothetical protein